MLYELCTAGQVTGAAIPYVRVRCSHNALTLQDKAGAQSQSSMPHPTGSLRSAVDPPSLSFLEETEGLSNDLPAASQLSVEPRLALWLCGWVSLPRPLFLMLLSLRGLGDSHHLITNNPVPRSQNQVRVQSTTFHRL